MRYKYSADLGCGGGIHIRYVNAATPEEALKAAINQDRDEMYNFYEESEMQGIAGDQGPHISGLWDESNCMIWSFYDGWLLNMERNDS